MWALWTNWFSFNFSMKRKRKISVSAYPKIEKTLSFPSFFFSFLSHTVSLFYLASIIVSCYLSFFIFFTIRLLLDQKALNQASDKNVTNGSMNNNNNKPGHAGQLKLFNFLQLSTEATWWNINLLQIT